MTPSYFRSLLHLLLQHDWFLLLEHFPFTKLQYKAIGFLSVYSSAWQKSVHPLRSNLNTPSDTLPGFLYIPPDD